MKKVGIMRSLQWCLPLAILMGILMIRPSWSYAGNISSTDKYAWSENSGWVNFNPTHGGVTVYSSYLEGYIWAENIGWIKLGNDAGGPYNNTSASDWGINNDGSGNLSGYAWSENAGWVNFNPTHSQATINTATGSFDGYAWGENIGWIHFKNTSPAYNVVTTWAPPSGGVEEPVKVVLTVSSTSPSNGATNVSVGTAISVKFSILINGSTVNTDSFYVTGHDGNKIDGVASTSSYDVIFTPTDALSYSTTYTAVATTKIQAANWAGTQMDSNYTWSFTTESIPIVPALTPTATQSPTTTVALSPTPTPTPAVVPTQTSTPAATPPSPVEATPTPTITEETPTPSPTPTPAYEGNVSLSKEVAYLSGDTVIVTVADSYRNTGAETEEILTTALKISGDNYYIGNDLLLDLNEDGADSGTFLATLKTGTTTTGSADAGNRSNIGTIKTEQDGTVTVIYSPDSSVSVTKKLSFSSYDATLAFSRPVYLAGEYAEITLSDAESNADHKEAETLLGQVYVQTSQFNTVGVWMAEAGTDTGVFMGSIQISADSTLGYERIQASEENTLTASYYDETTTTGFPQLVTDTCSVATMSAPTVTPTPAMPVPSPEITPSPNVTPSIPVPAPTPSTGACDEAEKITVSPDSLELEKGEEWQVTIKVTGVEDCMVEGVRVNRKISTSNKKKIMVQPSNQKTDAEGKAVFTITAKKDKCNLKDNCNAKAQFKANGVKEKAEVVVWLMK